MKPTGKLRACGQILLIPHEDITPNRSQPRKSFDRGELESLADSIRSNGILQPLNVRELEDGRYELISGERRLRAARLVGLSSVPCIIIEASDESSALYALLENLQRQDLGFFEESEAIARLIVQFDMSQEEIAAKLGKAQSTVSNKLRLLRLPEEIRREITRANLTERHARALLKLNSMDQLKRAMSMIVERRLNVAETDRLISQMIENTTVQRKAPLKLFKDVRIFVNTLNHAVDTMRMAGIEADAAKSETEEYIEYVVRIPKTSSCMIKPNASGA
ncbi:MAG: ParB/RepB/Spo0J family partition protein [Oscillospiraceae bacterium]|nr:ParB/RepB/Spo0J family partition protein [Oscillospiraceae bacterium]